LNSGNFGPKTFWHHQTGAEVSEEFGTSAEVSRGWKISANVGYLLSTWTEESCMHICLGLHWGLLSPCPHFAHSLLNFQSVIFNSVSAKKHMVQFELRQNIKCGSGPWESVCVKNAGKLLTGQTVWMIRVF